MVMRIVDDMAMDRAVSGRAKWLALPQNLWADSRGNRLRRFSATSSSGFLPLTLAGPNRPSEPTVKTAYPPEYGKACVSPLI